MPSCPPHSGWWVLGNDRMIIKACNAEIISKSSNRSLVFALLIDEAGAWRYEVMFPRLYWFLMVDLGFDCQPVWL